MRAAALLSSRELGEGKNARRFTIAALGFGCELCSQLEDLVLVMRGQGLKQCEDVGDVVHFSSLGHPCVFGAGWNYNATARRLATGIFNREEAAQCQNIPAITSDRTVCMRRSSASTASARPSAGKPTRKYGEKVKAFDRAQLQAEIDAETTFSRIAEQWWDGRAEARAELGEKL